MATCAVIGEAAGSGAALSVEKGITPRELHNLHMHELQQTMLRQDASIIGIRNEDPLDLALSASVSSSSTLAKLAVEQAVELYPIGSDLGLLLPVDPAIDGLELLVDASESTKLTVELWDTGRAENYVPHSLQAEASASLNQGKEMWVKLDLSWAPQTARNAFFIIKANPHLALHLSNKAQSCVLAFIKGPKRTVPQNLEDHPPDQPVDQWSMRQFIRKPICFRLTSPTQAFAPLKVADGYNRPYGGPHLWSSANMNDGTPEWLELSWNRQIKLSLLGWLNDFQVCGFDFGTLSAEFRSQVEWRRMGDGRPRPGSNFRLAFIGVIE